MGFTFKNYERDVDIAGNIFTITCNTDMGDLILSVGQDAEKLTEEIRSGAKTNKDALVTLKNSIDKLLGAGAVKRIFDGRKITTSDCVDIIVYIAKTVADVQRELRD